MEKNALKVALPVVWAPELLQKIFINVIIIFAYYKAQKILHNTQNIYTVNVIELILQSKGIQKLTSDWLVIK